MPHFWEELEAKIKARNSWPALALARWNPGLCPQRACHPGQPPGPRKYGSKCSAAVFPHRSAPWISLALVLPKEGRPNARGPDVREGQMEVLKEEREESCCTH